MLTPLPISAERFLREIKLVATLDHPNIAGLRTALRSGTQMLMIMEYVDGQPLDQLPNKDQIQPNPPIPATPFTSSCKCSPALSYAHQRGAIHHDVSPPTFSSVPITRKAHRLRHRQPRGDPRLTGPGMALGSPYSCHGADRSLPGRRPLRHYSVGVTLYEIVTGRRPVQATASSPSWPPTYSNFPFLPSISCRTFRRNLLDHRNSLCKNLPTTASRAPKISAPHYRMSIPTSTPTSQPPPRIGFLLPLHNPRHPPRKPHHQLHPHPILRSGLLETAGKNLATYIGPIARFATRATKTARSRQDLYEKLAEEIPSPRDRPETSSASPASSAPHCRTPPLLS